jgi:hypothetical protein
MKNILESLVNNGTEVTSIVKGELHSSIDVGGVVTITKGNLSMEVSFYTRLLKDYGEVVTEDLEIQEESNFKLGDLKIDNLLKLKVTLVNSGLSSVAKNLEISDEEKNTEIYKAIQNSSKFKNFYGKKAVLIDTLSDKEIEIIKVNWLINNYDTLSPNHYKFRNYTIKEEVKEEVVEPSTEPNKFITRNMNKEELQDKLKTLKSL